MLSQMATPIEDTKNNFVPQNPDDLFKHLKQDLTTKAQRGKASFVFKNDDSKEALWKVYVEDDEQDGFDAARAYFETALGINQSAYSCSALLCVLPLC